MTIRFIVRQRVDHVRIGVGFNTLDGIRVATLHHTDGGLPLFGGEPGRYEITFHAVLPLLPNSYLLSVGSHSALGGYTIDYIPDALRFEILELSATIHTHQPHNAGLVRMAGTWESARPLTEDSPTCLTPH